MRHLPTGTVMLLFTDIEGSTRLLQQVGERYADVLAECRQVLRTVFHQWNGHEVDTQIKHEREQFVGKEEHHGKPSTSIQQESRELHQVPPALSAGHYRSPAKGMSSDNHGCHCGYWLRNGAVDGGVSEQQLPGLRG